MEILVLIAFGLMFVGAMLYNQKQLEERQERAAKLAVDLGLKLRGNEELMGVYDGVRLSQYSKDLGGSSSTDWWSFTRCTLLDDLPKGMTVANQGFLGHLADAFGAKDIQLGNELDPRLRIASDHEADAQELLNEDEVHAVLSEIVGDNGQISLKDRELEVRFRGHHLDHAEPHMQVATRLVHALANARRKHWEVVGAVYGLELSEDTRTLTGEVTVTWDRGLTEIRATIPGLPEGTEIKHADWGHGDVELGDPILDPLVAVRTSDRDALAARIVDDAVRGPLLEVVHGYPGSRIDETGFVLLLKRWPGLALEKAVEAALALKRALEG